MMTDTPAEAEKMAKPIMTPETKESAEETAEKPAADKSEPSSTARPVRLDDHFIIDPSQPFEELNTPTATAYLAEDRRDPGRKLYALICNPKIPVRMKALDAIKGTLLGGMLSLVASGPVKWAPMRRKCMALIYEKPLGGPVVQEGKKGLSHISDFDFPNVVIRPLLRAISELETRGVSHRAINPSNVYFLDEACEKLVLGDCLATPPAYCQPILYETIPNGLSDPNGRSEGNSSDDIYALACTIIFLIVGSHPIDRLTDDQRLAAKIEKGTFSTLCTKTRVPVSLLESLRGMLNDDSSLRWGVKEVDGWLNGLRQSSPQRKPTVKGDLPFDFLRYEHVSPRTIAHAFSKNVPEAITAIKEGELTSWVRRILHNPTLSETIAAIAEGAKPKSGDVFSSDEYTVAKVCILLDPSAPIRYKGISFMPESVGIKLVMDLLEKKDINIIIELILNSLPNIWIAAQPGPPNSSRLKHLEKLYNQIKSYLAINEAGFGIERCIYELNEGLHCLSPLLGADYVINLEDLLPALDEAANRIDAKRHPVDRHIASFIVSQHNQNIDPHLKALSSPRGATRLVGVLSLLALLQWRFKPGPLYGLSSWVGVLLGLVINTYHSRTTRREIEREIPRLVRKGSLPDLFDLIDNIERRQIDNSEFNTAKNEFTEAEQEIKDIESNSASKRRQYENKGQQFAAMSSMIISMVIIMIFLVMESV
jgi:serine/threonine protein kinase